MSTLRAHLSVLTAVIFGAVSASAQDQLVLQALQKIESVEAGLQTLANGDVQAANQLLADLKWANKRLNAAYKKDTSHWKDAAKRLSAADEAVRKKAGAAPASETPAPKPAVDVPAGAGKGAESKPATGGATGPVLGEQFEKLQQLAKEVNNGHQNLQMLNKTFMGDAYRVSSTTKELKKLKTRLAEFPAGDKNVQIVATNLATFEKLFDTWMTEYKGDAEAADGLHEKLDAIAAKYDSKAMPGPISWPFDQDQLRIWAGRTQKLLQGLPADIAVVESATNSAIVGKKAASLLHWVGRSVPDRLNEQLEQVKHQCNSAVDESLRTAKSLREIKPDDKNAIVNRVLTEGALERNMDSLQKGMEAVARAAALDQVLEIADGPDRAAQHQEIESTIGVLRDLAKSALAEVRMPEAVKVDAETMAKLSAIAEETLAKKKYGVNEIQKLVVTSKMQRKEKTEGSISGTVTGATITSYHYVWDEYHVVTAEKVGDDVWIYHNMLKFYHSSDSVTPQDVWILSRRFQSTQILPENLKK